jgi:8-oxo-dGTP pyrophosphatase MutT (NUDIX family)
MGIQQIVRAIIPDVGDSYGYSPKEILDQDRRILFLQRSPHSKFGRLEWCLPGGKNENPAEPPNIAVFRETGQETGISVYELMNLGPHIIDEDPNGNIDYVNHYFFVSNWGYFRDGTNVELNGESVDFVWANHEEVSELDIAFPSDRKLLEWLGYTVKGVNCEV